MARSKSTVETSPVTAVEPEPAMLGEYEHGRLVSQATDELGRLESVRADVASKQREAFRLGDVDAAAELAVELEHADRAVTRQRGVRDGLHAAQLESAAARQRADDEAQRQRVIADFETARTRAQELAAEIPALLAALKAAVDEGLLADRAADHLRQEWIAANARLGIAEAVPSRPLLVNRIVERNGVLEAVYQAPGWRW
jgi:hypothetical protein